MPARIVYLGDEVTAAGFRLAGVEPRVPARGGETEALTAALREAAIVLVGIRCANAIAPRTLTDALALRMPRVMVIPDLDGTRPSSNPATRVRRILGIEA